MISTNIGFPFATNHQLVTDMANSAKKTIETIKPYVTRTNDHRRTVRRGSTS